MTKILSWGAVAINLLGSTLCSMKSIWCWPLFIFANVMLLVYFTMKKDKALIFLNISYMVINITAWWNWSRG